MKSLLKEGLADRPKGPKSGTTITERGLNLLKQIDATAVARHLFTTAPILHHTIRSRGTSVLSPEELPASTPEAQGDPAHSAMRGFSVSDLCRRWKVGPDKIRGFLRRGELIGINLATNLASRPQWRITPESVNLFERRRSSAPPPKRPHRRKTPLVDYYPGE
jgi:hypothetical protein